MDHPWATKSDTGLIESCLHAYDQHTKEIVKRAKQLSATNTISIGTIDATNLVYCTNTTWDESFVSLKFTETVEAYDIQTDELLWDYMEKEAKESKEVVSLGSLGENVRKELRTDRSHWNARSRMLDPFQTYLRPPKQHKVAWLLEENQKMAAQDALSARGARFLKE